jgi:DNA-directed RNA polymerase sigma subunit (sigma70/sigma32)
VNVSTRPHGSDRDQLASRAPRFNLRPNRPLSPNVLVVLWKQIETAAVARRQLKAGELSAAATAERLAKVERGARARNMIFEANVHSVHSCARSYATSARERELELDDVMQEGRLGLMRAIETFDRRARYSFDNYAAFLIQQSIRKALDAPQGRLTDG